MIDLHAHLMPGVDDGARDDGEAAAALARLAADGFRTVTATPHLDASLAARPAAWNAELERFDAAWETLQRLRDAAAPGLDVRRGAEVMLDTPEPDISDARARLAGGAAVLVEFPRMAVPPSMPAVLERIRADGFLPVVAHPERYDVALLGQAAAWRTVGAALAVNGRSLLGGYGAAWERAARELLARGLVDVVATDYHARGDTGAVAARELLERAGDPELAHLLLDANPARLLAGEAALPGPGVRLEAGLLERIRGLFR